MKQVILLLILFCCKQPAEAQLLKNLEKKVQDKLKQKVQKDVENSVDKKVDQAYDSLKIDATDMLRKNASTNESTIHENTEITSDRANEMMKSIMGGMTDAKYKNTYSFPLNAKINYQTFKNGKAAQEQTMVHYYADDAIMIETDKNTNTMILYDFANNSMLMIDTKKKTLQPMSLDFLQKIGKGNKIQSTDNKPSNFSFHPTGKTKSIAGYSCKEYETSTLEGKSLIWFTNSLDFDYTTYLKNFSKILGNEMNDMPDGFGYVMEMTDFDKDGTENMFMQVQSVNTKSEVVNTGDYKIQKLN